GRGVLAHHVRALPAENGKGKPVLCLCLSVSFFPKARTCSMLARVSQGAHSNGCPLTAVPPIVGVEEQKRAAAARALDFVQQGIRLGLGTGSTARHFVEFWGERVRAGLDVIAVPTSETTRREAEQFGIKLKPLDEPPRLDLTIDGADEIAPD